MLDRNEYTLVENFADGNCMYLAYSISLMFYLCKNQTHKDQVFKNLQLKKFQIEILDEILNRSIRDKIKFTNTDIDTIQHILGQVCREIAAGTTAKEYRQNPKASNIYTTGAFGLALGFKSAIDKYDQEFRTFIPRNDHGNFTEAELFLTPGIQNLMSTFVSRHKGDIEQKYNTSFIEFERENKDKLQNYHDRNFHKFRILTEIIDEKIKLFFAENDYQNLNLYIDFLKKDRQWSSEENLYALHRAVTGEQTSQTDYGGWHQSYEVNLTLGVTRNLQTGATGFPEQPDIILNHTGGIHWQSYIPCRYYKEQSDEQDIDTHSSANGTNKEPANSPNKREPLLLERENLIKQVQDKQKERDKSIVMCAKAIADHEMDPKLSSSFVLKFGVSCLALLVGAAAIVIPFTFPMTVFLAISLLVVGFIICVAALIGLSVNNPFDCQKVSNSSKNAKMNEIINLVDQQRLIINDLLALQCQLIYIDQKLSESSGQERLTNTKFFGRLFCSEPSREHDNESITELNTDL